MIRKFHEAKRDHKPEVELWGTGSPMREFLHADDLADACVYLMKTYNDHQFVNIGTGVDVTIKELAETIKNEVGFKGTIKWNSDKPDGTPRKLMNVDKLHDLGWKHTIDLKEGIAKVYAEYVASGK
jgi:GDP-L-fucose synthase